MVNSLLPITITRELKTAENDQVTCKSVIYYGDKEFANQNKPMPNKGINGLAGGVVIRGLPKLPAGEARMKMIFTIDLYAKLQVKFYSLDDGLSDFYRVDVKNLVENEELEIERLNPDE